ncbi:MULTISPECIES: alanine racemase [unclassified Aeromicrobium]|uniref:alanine racemase n=1 Tax=unclassified Aeromicrobium TaxID=2633570 RepID=UPI0006FAEA3E|nr:MULTISPECIES: alanine racemase [unclassified Aeromicrobium]KQO36328.1 alanine racemase [Aeromicrobium sp. Leaf245]KQP27800.1 alanine racemase [Aeromicrobium sp. Leaf272]KQP78452.1 alanine racemase [Aeromicrobium sp. Leaf289]KQP84162.1 alanine racemase [Aeromicrobium sp. Leaf291]
MSAPFARLLSATAPLSAPLAALDAPALWANADDLVRRAAGVPIRVASKSVRVRSVIERTLARPGFAGVMSYSLAESCWLVDQGVTDDVLLAYPTVDRAGLLLLTERSIEGERRRAAITLMIDSVEALRVVDTLVGGSHPELRVCLDVDASLRPGVLGVHPIHLGVRRSPVHSAKQAGALARAVSAHAGFDLVGVMFYDAQVAGLPDTSPAVRMVKRISSTELAHRRGDVVRAVSQHADLEIVNAGGTGSLEVTGADPAITELTAGSGLFTPTLFDGYDAFEAHPAAYFVLDVVRRPAKDVATCFAGGYTASGPAQANRMPTPVWPEGLTLLGTEGVGEVQTPVRGKAARGLRIGDRVVFRHAKAGEMCERFDAVTLVDDAGRAETVPTYRGEGKNFG